MCHKYYRVPTGLDLTRPMPMNKPTSMEFELMEVTIPLDVGNYDMIADGQVTSSEPYTPWECNYYFLMPCDPVEWAHYIFFNANDCNYFQARKAEGEHLARLDEIVADENAANRELRLATIILANDNSEL